MDLTSLDFGKGVQSIGESPFYGTKLTSIIPPNSLISIGEKAFYTCTGLTSVTFEGTHDIGPKLTNVFTSAPFDKVNVLDDHQNSTFCGKDIQRSQEGCSPTQIFSQSESFIPLKHFSSSYSFTTSEFFSRSDSISGSSSFSPSVFQLITIF